MWESRACFSEIHRLNTSVPVREIIKVCYDNGRFYIELEYVPEMDPRQRVLWLLIRRAEKRKEIKETSLQKS